MDARTVLWLYRKARAFFCTAETTSSSPLDGSKGAVVSLRAPAVGGATAAPPGGPSRARENLRLLRDPNFGPFFLGNLTANSGTWFLTLAAGIFVYRETGSAFLLGLVGFSQFV